MRGVFTNALFSIIAIVVLSSLKGFPKFIVFVRISSSSWASIVSTSVLAVFARVITRVVESAMWSNEIPRVLFVVLILKISFSLNALQLPKLIGDGNFTKLPSSGALILRRDYMCSLPKSAVISAVTRSIYGIMWNVFTAWLKSYKIPSRQFIWIGLKYILLTNAESVKILLRLCRCALNDSRLYKKRLTNREMLVKLSVANWFLSFVSSPNLFNRLLKIAFVVNIVRIGFTTVAIVNALYKINSTNFKRNSWA